MLEYVWNTLLHLMDTHIGTLEWVQYHRIKASRETELPTIWQ